ncbi:FAD binding domain-containing protein, partial [Desulfobulbus sp. US4]|nr:FAD binding domain-containing protein [Desulfobulbus sp. US4]
RTGLRGRLRRAAGKCLIGAGTTFTEIADSPDMHDMIPEIATHFERIASLPIRNRATVGGNIVNGSPIADGTIYLLALDAILHLRHHEERRSVALKDFFTGYKRLDLHDGELVESIEFPVLKKQTLFNFEKVCQRSHLDIASVNTAISLYLKVPDDSLASPDQPSCCVVPSQSGGMDVTAPQGIIEEVHISAGGVAPVPLYLQQTVAYLTGKEVTAEVIDRAIEVAKAEISPISDIRGAAAYKRLLLGQLIKAHFAKLLPDNAGGSQ